MAAETTIQACRLIKTFINECLLDMYLSSIRPSTQHGLTTIINDYDMVPRLLLDTSWWTSQRIKNQYNLVGNKLHV